MLRAQHGLQPAAAGSGPFGRLTVGLLARLLHRLGANFDQTSEAIQSTSQTRQNLGAHVVVVGHGGSIPAPPVISRDRLGRRDPGKCERTHISSVLTEFDVIVTNAGRWSGRTRGPVELGLQPDRSPGPSGGARGKRPASTRRSGSPPASRRRSARPPSPRPARRAIVAQPQMLGPDAVDERGLVPPARRPAAAAGSRRRPPPPAVPLCACSLASMKFIAGEPMKPATNRLAGRS